MSSLPPDPYHILGVSKDAQIPEIRSAHRKLVLKCHPDKVQDPELKALKQDEFQKVQQAYEILSNEKERQRYDDQVRLAELRKQTQSKANSSSPRTTPVYKYEVRTNDRSFKSSSSQTPGSEKIHVSYSKSYEEEARGPRLFDADVRTVRREASYTEKSSKDREREREREKEREKERKTKELAREERRRAEKEEIRRAEKEFKEQRRADKKAREKERDKDRKRETEEKKRHAKPYIETFEDDVHHIPVIKTEKKKSSSKKHDEKRDRSAHEEDLAVSTGSLDRSLDYAANYIEASRSKVPQAQRTAFIRHMQPPAAPTPPPAPGQSSPFAVPDDDDDARRSSAKPRRGSSGDKSYRKQPSREVLEDPDVVNVSPRRSYQKSTSAMPAMSGSPPRRDLPRTNTMPVDASYSRPVPPYMTRAQTYSGGGYEASDLPRGRGRSKLQSQVEQSDSEEDYDRHRSSKHRSSKKQRSPEDQSTGAFVRSYRVVDGGRTRLQGSYSRGVDASPVDYGGYYDSRPSMPARESSYHSATGSHKFPKVKMSKAYGAEDAAYSSHYHQPSYTRDYDSVYV